MFIFPTVKYFKLSYFNYYFDFSNFILNFSGSSYLFIFRLSLQNRIVTSLKLISKQKQLSNQTQFTPPNHFSPKSKSIKNLNESESRVFVWYSLANMRVCINI